MTVLEILYKDIEVNNIQYIPKVNTKGFSSNEPRIKFNDGYGSEHVIILSKGINGYMTFKYRGANYYIANACDKLGNVGHAIYRLCGDMLILANRKIKVEIIADEIIKVQDMKFSNFINYKPY